MAFKISQTNHVLKIWCDTKSDLSGATSVSIMYEKPSGVTGTWTGAVEEGKITYTTEQGEIDEEGDWKFQSRIVEGGNTIDGSEIDKIRIEFIESLN